MILRVGKEVHVEAAAGVAGVDPPAIEGVAVVRVDIAESNTRLVMVIDRSALVDILITYRLSNEQQEQERKRLTFLSWKKSTASLVHRWVWLFSRLRKYSALDWCDRLRVALQPTCCSANRSRRSLR